MYYWYNKYNFYTEVTMAKPKEQGFIATVKLGPKGQIVIPKEVREMFDIGPGDSLVLMAHPKRGIALQRQNIMMKIAQTIIGGNGKDVYPHEDEENLDNFAHKIIETTEEDE
jgi:AbrB family looped-hinge helix DNA binding protein